MGRGVYDPSRSDTFGTKKDGPNLVEGCPSISAREIPRDDPHRTAWGGAPVVTTTLPSGGIRFWFLCPRCAVRVGKLYDVAGQVACRRCHRLTYASQHEYVSRHPLLRGLQRIARLDALEARYKAGDASAFKPLRKLAIQMLQELVNEHNAALKMGKDTARVV